MIRRPFTVFLAIFAATALYTFTRPRIYQTAASLRLTAQLLHAYKIDGSYDIKSGDHTLEEHGATLIRIAESIVILRQVASRFPAADLDHMLAHRNANFDRATLSLTISYRDSDPATAAYFANLYAEEVSSLISRTFEIPAPFRITRATPPAPGDYVSPPVLLHLTLGALGGILAGLLTVRRSTKQAAAHPAAAQSSFDQK